MKKVLFGCVAVMVLLALVLGACGSPAPTTAPAKTTAAATTAPATSKPAATTAAATTPAASKPAATTAAPAGAQKQYWGPFYMYTTVMGSRSYSLMYAIAEVFKKNGSKVILEAKPSNGMTERLEYLKRNPDEAYKYMPIVSPSDMKNIWNGVGDYANYKMPFWRYTIGYSVPMYGFVTYNPNIKTLADLAGKTIGIGKKTQIAYGVQMEHLLKIAGVLDKVKLEWVGTGPAIEGLRDGIYDACITLFETPVVQTANNGRAVDTSKDVQPDAALEEVLSGRKKLYAIAMDPKLLAQLCQERGYGQNAFPCLIPKGTLGITPEDMYWLAMPYGWKVSEVIPDEVIYTFVKDYVKYQKDIEGYIKTFNVASPALYTAGASWDVMHPGAAEAIKEFGWSDLMYK